MEYGGLNAYSRIADIVPILDTPSSIVNYRIQDEERFQRFLAGDFERFTLASFESFYRSRIGDDDLTFMAWRLLESYYASFFAAHALMRALGGGVSYFGGAGAARIKELIDLYGLSDVSLPSGSVLFELVDQSSDWQLSIRPSAGGKGVHDGFWRDFCDFVQRRAAKSLELGNPDAADLLAASVELSDKILVGGIGTSSWLAETRNAINYRHEYNAWFPYHKSVQLDFRARLGGSEAEAVFRTDLSRSKETLALFENLNAKIVHILWDVADLFKSISRKPGHFGNRYSRLISLKG